MTGCIRDAARVGLLAGALCTASPSYAQPEVERARMLFNAGAQAYGSGRYPAAIQAFEEAYQLSKRSGLLFSIGQAYRQLYFVDKNPANLRAAVRYYREYLGVVKEGARVGDATTALADLEGILQRMGEGDESATAAPMPTAKKATRISVTSPTPDATLDLDGKDVGKLPYFGEVEPGNHKLTIRAPGHVASERDLPVKAGQFLPLDVKLDEQPAVLSVADAPSGAQVKIDGRPVGEVPIGSIEIEPGTHFVTVTKNGHLAYAREIDFDKGEQRKVKADLETTRQRTTSWVLMGAGVLGLGGGVLVGLGSRIKEREAQDLLAKRDKETLTPSERDRYDALRQERDDARTAALILAGAGGGIGATGLILYLFDEPRVQPPSLRRKERAPDEEEKKDDSAMEISAAPVWTPWGSGAVIRGSF